MQAMVRTVAVCGAFAVFAAALSVVVTLAAVAEPSLPYAGQSLADALRALEDRGLRLVYSTLVVRPSMRVESRPEGATPREILDSLLSPHGLVAQPAPGGRLVIRPAPEPAAAEPPETTEADVRTSPEQFETALDEIVVTSNYRLYRREPVSTAMFDREQILSLPHFGDDLYRAIALLPGVSGSDFSSRFSLRGGLYEEILVTLDGLELIEPFHLKDVAGFLSIVDPEIIDAVDLIPGVFPAEYGDRMAGVAQMNTTVPEADRRLRVGISVTTAWLGGSGGFAKGKGRFLASLRRGTLDVARAVGVGREDDADITTRYWDAFGRLDFALGPASSLTVRALAADDRFELLELDPPFASELDSDDEDAYLWLSHSAALGPRVVIDSQASAYRIDRDRSAALSQVAGSGEARDQLLLEILGFKQDWLHEPSNRWLLKWGVDARHYKALYDYAEDIELDDPVSTALRHRPDAGVRTFVDEISGDQQSFYLAGRGRFRDRWTAEVGARYDRQTWTGEDQVSPRLNLVLDLGNSGALRFGWGIFHQSQRPHELAVEDGETEFSSAQRARRWSIGWERRFGNGLDVRLDGYRRDVSNPRPRYESLFDPLSSFPQAEPDRVRIAPTHVHAEGLELFLGRRGGHRFDWWLSYALSSIRERVNGRDQPRSIDQQHALTLNVSFRLGRKWDMSMVWIGHSGWPTTAVGAEIDTGEAENADEIVFVPGPFYGENLPFYHRLDVRASRRTAFKGGTASFFIDAQNLYERRNARGFDVLTNRYQALPGGGLIPLTNQQEWLLAVLSIGVAWSF